MYDVAEGYCSWCSSDVIVENDINDESIAGVFVSTCSVDGGHGKVDAPRRDTGVDVTTTKPACSPGCSDGSACQTASDCLSSRCENHVCAESLECGAQCGPGAVCPYEVPPQLNEGQSCLASCADGAEIVSASVVNATNCSPTECPEAAASCAGDESCTVVVDAATCGPDPCYGTNKGWSLTITCGEAGDAGFDAATDVEEPDDGGTCGAEGGGPCSCTELGACPPGQACAGGVCMPSADVCVYSSQCNADQVCDDGQCLAACSPEDPCAPGFNCSIFGVCQPTSTEACTSNGQCPFTAPVCAAGTCSLSCSADAECPTGDYCDLGACVPDTRPSPDCSTNSQCADDQICDAGFCLYMCETSTQCADIDERIPVCSQNVCRSTAEANPQCTTQSECAEGESCISNQCE
jgi:hypothetical protein